MRRGSYASNDGNSGRGNGTGAQPAKSRIHPHKLKLRLGYPAIDIYPAVRDGLPRQRFAASTRPYLSEKQ